MMPLSFMIRSAGTCPHAMRFALSKLKKLQKSSQYVLSSCQGFSGIDVSTRCISTTHFRLQEASVGHDTPKDVVKTTPSGVEMQYKERFIPITRQSIIRYLMEEKDFLTDSEKKIFPEFARALDHALMNQYKGILAELKTLFDPINPDKDTVQTRKWSRREKLDNEFWLLQQLHEVVNKANFQELPKPMVEKLLKEHASTEGVMVSVDWNRYDVLRFWVLGHERPKVSLSLMERLTNAILRKPPREAMEYYKRVVVAIRLKKDSKLILKAFKEVPIHNLAMLLPDGTIKMTNIDKGILVTSVAIAAFGILAKVVTYLAHLHVEWMLVVASVTGLIGFRAWSMYKNRRNEYLIKVTQMLYYKNMANNRGLMALLVDRAEDESFKEVLLTYVFLLTSRRAVYRDKPGCVIPTTHIGGLTMEGLTDQIETWLEERTGANLHFDSSEAVRILKDLGLVSSKDDVLNSVMMDLARKMLPYVSVSAIRKEDDIMDGFDRDTFLETEDEYRRNDKKTRKYGWF